MGTKISKHDEYVNEVKGSGYCDYVNTDELIVGVYNTTGDMIEANDSKALKKLKNLYKYHIQMVIK